MKSKSGPFAFRHSARPRPAREEGNDERTQSVPQHTHTAPTAGDRSLDLNMVAIALILNREPPGIRLWLWASIEAPKLFLALGSLLGPSSMIVGNALGELTHWPLKPYPTDRRRRRAGSGRDAQRH